MGKRRYKGSITVFLSLIMVVFFVFACSILEGIRIQGTKVRAAACLDMGLFSVFGEYERKLLSQYHVFFLDGSYGTGQIDEEKILERLRFFINQNADLREEGRIDWFPVKNTEIIMKEFFIATDERGQGFFQQACLFMKGIEQIMNSKMESWQIEKVKEKVRMLQETKRNLLLLATKTDAEITRAYKIESMPWLNENPKNDILEQTISAFFPISSKEIVAFDKVSERSCEKGNMNIRRENKDQKTLFLEYLFFTFGNAAEQKERKGLLYELEYLLEGHRSDRQNLRYVCEEILEIRWADNFFTALQDEEKRKEAEAMINDWRKEKEKGKEQEPEKEIQDKREELDEAQIQLFLLAWAYQESILDVKRLLCGFYVPLEKDGEQWQTEAEFWKNRKNNIFIEEDITGIWDYEGYLRLLFEIKQDPELPMKALDLIEWELKSNEETANFRADYCIGGMKVETHWEIEPFFFRISEAFLNVGKRKMTYKAEGSFLYETEV